MSSRPRVAVAPSLIAMEGTTPPPDDRALTVAAVADDAARLLRVAVAALPPRTTVERATARRLEGAAIVLDALAALESAT